MGGTGSGRRWHDGSKGTAESYRSIDARWMKREGMLTPGAERRITWSRRGEVYASVHISAELGRMVLTHRWKDGGGDWAQESYPVSLTTTPCHLGGKRHWFCCPIPGCGKRVAVIYCRAVFACRTCHQLAFSSQREDEADRSRRKADRIRDRLGWPRGLWNGSHWGKPKGMHWSTYERLRAQHRDLENIVNCAFIARVTALYPSIGRRLSLR
jgi:hypothetical protein